MPDLTLASQAQNLHDEITRGIDQRATTKNWEQLLRDLLSESSKLSNVVFVVDALDECDRPEDVVLLLKFMSEIMSNHSNVQLICSSHQHVRVDQNLTVGLHKVDLTTSASAEDMKAFVNGEIEYLRGEIKEKSIFCE